MITIFVEDMLNTANAPEVSYRIRKENSGICFFSGYACSLKGLEGHYAGGILLYTRK